MSGIKQYLELKVRWSVALRLLGVITKELDTLSRLTTIRLPSIIYQETELGKLSYCKGIAAVK